MNEIIYGIHTILNAFKKNPKSFLKVFVLEKRNNIHIQKLLFELKFMNISIQIKNRFWLDKIAKGAVHQGIIAIIKKSQKITENNLLILLKNIKMPFFLILDRITDPHNLGACLRSANAAGVHAVIIPNNNSAKMNSTVKKVACGAAENIPLIYVTNLVRTIRFLKENNIWIIGSVINNKNIIYKSKLNIPLALVMGSENKGIRYLTLKNCDELISIPINKDISSLNVSVATGICLFEIIRQRYYENN